MSMAKGFFCMRYKDMKKYDSKTAGGKPFCIMNLYDTYGKGDNVRFINIDIIITEDQYNNLHDKIQAKQFVTVEAGISSYVPKDAKGKVYTFNAVNIQFDWKRDGDYTPKTKLSTKNEPLPMDDPDTPEDTEDIPF